jgi:hypothetical protein
MKQQLDGTRTREGQLLEEEKKIWCVMFQESHLGQIPPDSTQASEFTPPHAYVKKMMGTAPARNPNKAEALRTMRSAWS